MMAMQMDESAGGQFAAGLDVGVSQDVDDLVCLFIVGLPRKQMA